MKSFWSNIRYYLPLHIILRTTDFLPDNVLFLKLRGLLCQFFFGMCGKNLKIGRNVTFYNPQKIRIGNDVYIANGCWIQALGEVEIGDEVMLAPYVVISAGTHTRKNSSYRFGEVEGKNVKIGRGCWIGSHVTITGETKIGGGSIVAANSCVSGGEYEDNILLGGVPAVVKKRLEND